MLAMTRWCWLAVWCVVSACGGDEELSGPTAYLKASNTDPGDLFGSAVAISADGRTIAVGAPNEASPSKGVDGDQGNAAAAPGFGAVYVFVKTGAHWVQQAYVKSPTGQQGWVGSALALSGDGNTLVVGGYQDHQPDESGGAYAYVRDPATQTWSFESELVSSAAKPAGFFGWSIALSADGNTAVVGAYDEDSAPFAGGQSYSGYVHVFVRDRAAHAWSHQAALASPHPAVSAYDGWSVALSSDGTTLAFGATGDASSAGDVGGDETDTHAEASGAVFVFARSGTTWTEQGYLKATQPRPHVSFGTRIALARDGSTLAAYEPGANTDAAVYTFTRDAAHAWHADGALPDAVAGTQFGAALAFSDDGARLVVGVPDDPTVADRAGSFLIYRKHGASWQREHVVLPPIANVDENFGGSLAVAGHTLVVGAFGDPSAATGVDGDPTNTAAPGAGAAYLWSF